MNKHQVNRMREELKDTYEYGQYLYEQAQLFSEVKDDPNYIDYNKRYWQNKDLLEGMLRMYAIAICVTKTDLESHLKAYIYEY